jgi:hypothetical protein
METGYEQNHTPDAVNIIITLSITGFLILLVLFPAETIGFVIGIPVTMLLLSPNARNAIVIALLLGSCGE